MDLSTLSAAETAVIKLTHPATGEPLTDNGEPLTVRDFTAGEPNEGFRCVVYGRGLSAPNPIGWLTRACSEMYPVICERP